MLPALDSGYSGTIGAISQRMLVAGCNKLAQPAPCAVDTMASSKCGGCLIFKPLLPAASTDVQAWQAYATISMA